MAGQEYCNVATGQLRVLAVAKGLTHALYQPIDEKEREAQPVGSDASNRRCEWESQQDDSCHNHRRVQKERAVCFHSVKGVEYAADKEGTVHGEGVGAQRLRLRHLLDTYSLHAWV